jgi:hypothetical protein
MADELQDQYGDDALMGRLLREHLPRHRPPAHLRAHIVDTVTGQTTRGWATLWVGPLASALAMALIMILLITPSLPTTITADPIRLISQAVISEHARTILWGEARADVVPAALPRAMQQSGVELSWVFTGDDEIQLINAQADGHAVTYVVLPARTLALPERGRVQIDRWRPLVRKEGGFSLIIWKQQELLCVLVSDLVSDSDLRKLKEYFVKVRSSTEPYAVY